METYKKNIHRWVYFRDENSVYNMKTQRVVRYLDKLAPDPQGGVIRLVFFIGENVFYLIINQSVYEFSYQLFLRPGK